MGGREQGNQKLYGMDQNAKGIDSDMRQYLVNDIPWETEGCFSEELDFGTTVGSD